MQCCTRSDSLARFCAIAQSHRRVSREILEYAMQDLNECNIAEILCKPVINPKKYFHNMAKSVVAPLLTWWSSRQWKKKKMETQCDIKLRGSFNLENLEVCRLAMRRSLQNSFWVGGGDPLINSAESRLPRDGIFNPMN